MRYLNQRYAMPYKECKAILTDIGTEELAHQEMIAAIVYQLTRNLTPEQIKEGGFDAYFVDHTTGIYPQSAAGVPFTAAALQSKGDPITDLFEDLAAEQKARTTYDNLLRLIDNPDVREPLKFLRAREVVHFQRFGDANLTKLSAFYPLQNAALPVGHRVAARETQNPPDGLKRHTTTNRQGVLALAVCYMFQMICVLPSSRMRILWIIIMATDFFC